MERNHPDLRNLRKRWDFEQASLQTRFPQLSMETGVLSDQIKAYDDILAILRASRRSRKFSKIMDKIDNNLRAVSRWVTKPINLDTVPRRDPLPLDAQSRIRAGAAPWIARWNKPQPAPSCVDEFMRWIPAGGFACNKISLTAEGLRTAAKRGRGSSAGADGVAHDWLSCLPLAFFEELAVWFNSVLRHPETVPADLSTVFVALIPKDADSTRPISVTSALWRIGLTAILNQLQPWVAAWTDKAVIGGLPGLGTDDALQPWIAHLMQARATDSSHNGAKIDFSSVSIL